MLSTPNSPASPAKASIPHINFSTTKRAPLTPLRAFRPTPVKQAGVRNAELQSPPCKTPTFCNQEPLFLDGPDTPVVDSRVDAPGSPTVEPEENTVELIGSPAPVEQLVDSESEQELPIRRVPPRTPRRIAVSDSESDSSPVAGPSRAPLRRVIDMTGSDDECEEEDQTQAWMDKYYDDSAGSLRDFIVDDSDESGEEDSDDSDDPVRPTSRKSNPKPPAGKSTPTADLDLPDFNRLTIVDSDDDDETESISRPVIPTTPGRKSKKSWEQERVKIAEDVFADLDKRVFEGKLGRNGAGATIEWSNRMLTTAGTANQQKKREADGSTKQVVKITLSMKVCTGEEQILSTVAHEMCHLATWIISKEMKNPHGRLFKSWGAKVMKARRDIEVTTKHTYEIEYKFQWKCVKEDCGKIYQRHSKSIDVEKDRCSRCRGALEPMFETKETAYQAYLKQNMGYAKQALPGASHGDVMRALALRWKTAGQDGNHLEYWLAEIAA